MAFSFCRASAQRNNGEANENGKTALAPVVRDWNAARGDALTGRIVLTATVERLQCEATGGEFAMQNTS